MTTDKKVATDWEAIERDFRTTNLSNAELARKHGGTVSPQRIGQRAKKEGWTRDLTQAVRAATGAKVIAEEVKRRNAAQPPKTLDQKVSQAFEETVTAVEVAAEAAAAVIMRHRDDAAQARGVVLDLLNELRAATIRPDELEQLFMAVSSELDEKMLAFARMKFNDMLKLHTRIGSVQKLADAFAKLQALERKAHGLDGEGDDGKPKAGDDLWGAVAADVAAES
jgi:hypothetical protein